MKVRTAFVANSSSSSFLIAHKAGDTKVKITIEVDLQDFIRRSAKTPEEIDEICRYNEYDEKTRAELLMMVATGHVISDCVCHTDDGGVESFIAEAGQSGDSEEIAQMLKESTNVTIIKPEYSW